MKVDIILMICLLFLFAWKNVQVSSTTTATPTTNTSATIQTPNTSPIVKKESLQNTNNVNNLTSQITVSVTTAATTKTNTSASIQTPNASPITTATNTPSVTAATNIPSATAATNTPTATAATNTPSVTAATNIPSATAATNTPSVTAATNTPSATAATNIPSATAATNIPSATAATNIPSATAATNTASATAATITPLATAAIYTPFATAAIDTPSATAATDTPSATATTKTTGTKDATRTTSSQPTSISAATEQTPKISPNLKETNATKISYKLVIVMNFTEQLKNKSSADYKNASRNAKLKLEQKFKRKTKEQNLTINVTGFEKGSVVILYEVTLQTYGKTSKQLIELNKELYEAATIWNGSRVLDKIVDESKTSKAVKKEALIQNICSCPVPFICEEEGDQLMCKHRCGSNEKIKCGAHGQCVYDLKRNSPICHCTKSEDTLYYGERCEHSTSNLQSLPSKLTILAISGGVGGALLLIIFISTVCFCYRLKNAKQRRSFSETSSKYGSDIVRENQKMENIPLESGKDNPSYREEQHELGRRYLTEQPHTTKSNPIYRDDFEDQRKRYQTDQEPRQQGHNRISRGSINTQASNNRPRTESTGYRQPMKNNYFNDSESSYRDQRESENSYRPRDFNSERHNPRGRPEEISRDRNNSKGWLEESSNDRNKPMGRSEEFIGDRNNPRRWPEEKSNDRTYQRGRSEESSICDDRYVYIDGDGGVRRLFKRVDDKELGGETLIYQPSNMPRPIQRENVDSVGDNFIMRPAPPKDDQRRSSFYDTIDAENPYKIKRPNIKHTNLYS